MVGVVQDVTERRIAQRAAEESAAQFHTFAQTLPNHVWTSPPDGQLDWFNDRVYEYSGAKPGELDGQGWAQIVHPEDRSSAGERWSAALSSGEIYDMEFRVRRRDGAYRWHLARAVPILSADGTISRWIGTNTDIHQRKLAEAQSTRDRDRIWTLSQELMLVCDFEGVISAVNPSAMRLLGWSEDEMIGRTIAEFVHPDDRNSTAAEVSRLSRGVTTRTFESRYRTKAGAYRLLDWAAVPDGGHIHAIARDITQERTSAAERERIWSSTNDLMGTAGVDGYLKSVNPAWHRLLGYDEQELLSRPLVDFVAEEERAKRTKIFERLGAGESVRDLEDRLVHKDGRRSLIAWSAEPVGNIFYIVGRDVTEQRAAEEALRQSQKMEAVGQLTGGIAHDFNNLLQGISGSLNLLQKRIADGRLNELDQFIRGAMASANRAAALTHRLLAFSRRQPLDPRPVRANPLVSSMEDLLRRTLGESVLLEIVLAGGLWLTKCDPNQLESAILNLVVNARDAMPDGGRLTIETGNAQLDTRFASIPREVGPGSYVCISVTDTGTGMSADTIDKAFEPFFTTKPIGQGTGLGLSMIYGFARQSNGYAKIYSELGKGTTVKLYLPRHRGRVEDDTPLPDLTAAHNSNAHETVMVVEDELVVRTLIVEVLNDLGYRSLEAADGPSGLEMLRSERLIDLLVTDVGLPGLNGRQLAEAARQFRPNLKVLFMTGYAENAALASGFLEPGMSMITKPFAMEALATRIRQILEVRRLDS
jgi:PAS domain S-box-containing protein